MQNKLRYKLNFTGFKDTRYELFGYETLTESGYSFDLNIIENILAECISTLKSKLNINIIRDNIIGIQFMNENNFAAQTLVVERKEYILLFNYNKISSRDELINSVYHELGHVYQLDKLFNEKIIAYDSIQSCLTYGVNGNLELINKHLAENGGHTLYWLDYVDKVNNIIKPNLLISAYLKEDHVKTFITEELYEEDYFNLDFTGFKDTEYELFGVASKDNKGNRN